MVSSVCQIGVMSVALQGEDKNILVVVGYSLDAIELVKRLRKKHRYAEILSVEMISGEKC